MSADLRAVPPLSSLPLTVDEVDVPAVVLDGLDSSTEERDRARDTAIRLEQQNAELVALVRTVADEADEMGQRHLAQTLLRRLGEITRPYLADAEEDRRAARS